MHIPDGFIDVQTSAIFAGLAAAVVGLTGANADLKEIVPIETANEKAELGTPSAIKAKYSNVTTLSDKELKTLLKAVGFEGQGLKMAWAVAKKESNGRPLAFNGNKNTGDHCLVTIDGGNDENYLSYNEPNRELTPLLVKSIVQFCSSLK